MVIATAINGVAAGATLDQAIKQLPARHRIGTAAYLDYARAADLQNGLLWYPALGLGAAATSLAAAAIGMTDHPGTARAAGPIAVAAATVAHLMATLRAAPIMIGLRAGIDHPTAAVAADLDRFARTNVLRAGAMVIALAAAGWTATRSDATDHRSR